MPRITTNEATSIGLLTHEEQHDFDRQPVGPWDVCNSCYGDNQLKSSLAHPNYEVYSDPPVCLVCGNLLLTRDNRRIRITDKEKDMKESQPDPMLTELEEYCQRLRKDITRFEATMQENNREIESLEISNRINATAIEATMQVLESHEAGN